MRADVEERTRAEVRDAYAAVTRLRVYARLTLLVSVVFFVATLGGMVVGWFPVGEGVVFLASAALIGLSSGAKLYDGVHRTTLYAMDLERSLPDEGSLDASSLSDQSAKIFSMIAVAATVLLGAGILGYSFANAGTQLPITSLSEAFVAEEEREDDDDVDTDGADGSGDGTGESQESESDDD